MNPSLHQPLCNQLHLTLCVALVLSGASNFAVANDDPTAIHAKHDRQSEAETMPTNYLKGMLKTSKTGMGAQLDYVFISPTVDQFGLLQLTITRRAGGGDATISILPDHGLLLTEGLPSSTAPFNPGASYTLKVQPNVAGLRYLNIFLKSGARGEALAIPVQLGMNANLYKSGTTGITPDGRRVISIPAQ